MAPGSNTEINIEDEDCIITKGDDSFLGYPLEGIQNRKRRNTEGLCSLNNEQTGLSDERLLDLAIRMRALCNKLEETVIVERSRNKCLTGTIDTLWSVKVGFFEMIEEIITENAIFLGRIKESRVELEAAKLESTKLWERIASSAVARPTMAGRLKLR